MNHQDIATIMGFPSEEAMTEHKKLLAQQLEEAADIEKTVAALRQLQNAGDQFFSFAGQDLLCDANYRVSLAVGLTDTGFVTTAVLCGGYPIDVLSCERDRNSNFITINFPPGTSLDRDDASLLQNAIYNKETGGWVKFSDPNLTRSGWEADIEIRFRDPDDDITMDHVESILIDARTLSFWPQFLAAVVRQAQPCSH